MPTFTLKSALLLSLLSLTLHPSTLAFDYASVLAGGGTGAHGRNSSVRIVPNRYILEFDAGDSDVLSQVGLKRRGDGTVDIHDHVYRQLAERGIDVSIFQTYDSDLFQGASVDLSNPADLATLAGLSGVAQIYPVEYVPAPLPLSSSWGEDSISGYRPDWNIANKDVTPNTNTNSKRSADGDAGEKKRFLDIGIDLGGLFGWGGGKSSTTASSSSSSTTRAGTTSRTGTSSTSRSGSVTGSQSATRSGTGSGSATGSNSATGTRTGSGTASASSTAPASQNTSPPQPRNPTGFSAPLTMGGVDKIQAGGNTGQGVKIAVIDSGVFYNNPALGGGFGPGYRIAGGKDYVGDNFDGSNQPEPDNDPMDCTGHGTFVTGIIATAQPNAYNVTGVAPGASIYAYRVFSCYSATTNDIIAKAMQDAYTDGNDVINLSLGADSAWSGSILSVIAARIQAKGVFVAASSGNDGYAGAFYTQSPGTGAGVASVGSVDSIIYPSNNATLSTRSRPFSYVAFNSFQSGTFPAVAFTTAPSTNDGCPIPANSFDYANVVLIVQRPTDPNCDLYNGQLTNLINAGVRHVLVVNTPNTAYIPAGRFGLDWAMISYEDGQEILAAIAAGKKPLITFGFAPNPVANTFTGGLPTPYTSIGPTNELNIKPQLLGPGQYVVSTAPTASGFGSSGGTSYSCPYIAGVAALYLSANGGRKSDSAATILKQMQLTATPKPSSQGGSGFGSVTEQGAGLIQGFNTLNNDIQVSQSEILLNDTSYGNNIQTITLVNRGRSIRTVYLNHQPASSIFTRKQGSFESEVYPLPQSNAAANVIIVPSTLILIPNVPAIAIARFSRPSSLDAKRLPVYSGFVQITGATYPMQIPYLGAGASMRDFPILDYSDVYTGDNLPVVVAGSTVQTGPRNYTLAENDRPNLMYRFWTGTQAFYVDLIKANQNIGFTPTVSSPGYNPSPAKPRGNGRNVQFNSVQTIGNAFTLNWVARNTDANSGNGISTYTFKGNFFNGTKVPSGSYQFLVRALRVTGNSKKEDDYDSWVSPIFGF